LQNKKEEVEKEASESFFFFKNDYNTDDSSANLDVSEFIVHPDWDPKDSHYGADIAIAVLKKPVNISREVGYVCLNTPSNPIQSFVGKIATVYGWGLTEEHVAVTELRDVEIPLVDQAHCNSSRPVQRLMSDTSFCAGAKDEKTGACSGNFSKIQMIR
jgi:hypothetical protein